MGLGGSTEPSRLDDAFNFSGPAPVFADFFIPASNQALKIRCQFHILDAQNRVISNSS